MVALEFVLAIAMRNQVLATVAMVALPILVAANWRTANQWRRERDTCSQSLSPHGDCATSRALPQALRRTHEPHESDDSHAIPTIPTIPTNHQPPTTNPAYIGQRHETHRLRPPARRARVDAASSSPGSANSDVPRRDDPHRVHDRRARRSGQPITDLTKEDIIVTEQGSRERSSFFASTARRRSRRRTRFRRALHEPVRNVAERRAPHHSHPRRRDEHADGERTYQFTQATTRIQILTYLDGLPPHTRVGLFRLGAK